jgi:hypothetical protein
LRPADELGDIFADAYELAVTSGRNYSPGDQLSYYIKATPKRSQLTKLPNVPVSLTLRTATKTSIITWESSMTS